MDESEKHDMRMLVRVGGQNGRGTAMDPRGVGWQ